MTSLAKLLRVTVAVLIVACSSLFPVAARAQDGDVLKGRTVRVIIGGAPGETTDTDSRTFFTHLQAALPQTTFRQIGRAHV